jgi:hypothetical protein
MSQQFIRSFFPSLASHFPRSIGRLFPADVAILCPEATLTVSVPIIMDAVNSVRNPVLAVHAIVGIFIGIVGSRSYSMYEGGLWSMAFFCFGGMNVAAFPLHCILPTPYDAPSQYPLLWAFDCFFTGSSAMALVGASLCLYKNDRRFRKLNALFNKPTIRSWIRWNRIGFAAIGLFFFLPDTILMRTLPLELWYLVPCILAGFVLLLLLLLGSKKPKRGALTMLLLGGVCVVAGPVLDAPLCRWTRGALGDALTVSTLTFAGSDLAFVGIGMWLMSTPPLESEKKSR